MTLPLPGSCQTCPFWQYRNAEGNGFVPDAVVEGSEVFFLAQGPGRDEVAGHQLVKRHFTQHGQYQDEYRQVVPQPLIGATGQQFNNRFLPLTGLKRHEVSLGNAIRCRPGKALSRASKADELPPLSSSTRYEDTNSEIARALKHCKTAHLHIPSSVKLVVTMGKYALFTMTGIVKDENEYGVAQGVIESWRGYAVDVPSWHITQSIDTNHYHSLHSDTVVFVTMHIAALNYGMNKRFMHATLQDFYKIGRFLQKKWPIPLPSFSTTRPDIWPTYAAFDTEYIVDQNNQLERWSLCDTQLQTYCIEAVDTPSTGIPVQPGSTVVIQNALADIDHLSYITDLSAINIEDMMLAHSVLWSGEPHSLNYLNSMFGVLNRYKHLSKGQPQLYSALDAYEPMRMWLSYFLPEFRKDKESWSVYKKFRLPLINIIHKAEKSGVKVNTHRLAEVQEILQGNIYNYQSKAQNLVNDPLFNLNGRNGMMHFIHGTPLEEKKAKILGKNARAIALLKTEIDKFMRIYGNG